MKHLCLIICFLASITVFASTEVAFLEIKDRNGRVIQLEPNGQFAHIAIKYRGKWLHAHPMRGVEFISQKELEKIGTIKATGQAPLPFRLPDTDISKVLGKAYDFDFSWSDDRFYCSELVAKLLHIPPTPMHIDKERLGLSPDEIFAYFKEHNYVLTSAPHYPK